MITVTSDPSRKLVRAHMSGMLTVDEVKAFGRDEQAAVRGMALASGEFVLLVETEGNLIQTQDVIATFAELMVTTPLKARRIATVRDGVLTRMQSRRVAKLREGSSMVFETVAEAEAWLFQ